MPGDAPTSLLLVVTLVHFKGPFDWCVLMDLWANSIKAWRSATAFSRDSKMTYANLARTEMKISLVHLHKQQGSDPGSPFVLQQVALNSCTFVLTSTVLLHKWHGFVVAIMHVNHIGRISLRMVPMELLKHQANMWYVTLVRMIFIPVNIALVQNCVYQAFLSASI